MSDLISRADVFEIIDKAFSQPMRKGVKIYADICLMLNTLPTHANSRSTHERDLISRADAIEVLAQQLLFEANTESPYVNDDDIGEFRKLAEELFKDVPSAKADIGEYADRLWKIVYERGKSEAVHKPDYSYEADMVRRLKEAQSAEAVQGEWIRVGHDIYECSLCHQNIMTKDIDCYSYCHRCGARMKGGAE